MVGVLSATLMTMWLQTAAPAAAPASIAMVDAEVMVAAIPPVGEALVLPEATGSGAASRWALTRRVQVLLRRMMTHAAEPSAQEGTHAARPQPLIPLYGAFMSLEALDVHSTRRALDGRRCHEGNPMVGGMAGNTPAFLASKAAAAGAIVWATELLWKRNRAAAVVMMATLTGTMAAVDVHNYRIGR